VSDGFDVRPEQLRHGAADLRDDADRLDNALLAVGAGVDQVTGACGPGPLAGAATELAEQLDRAVAAIRASVEDGAGALDASSVGYLASDGRASSVFGAPGLDGLR
jgi:hypothetical protein